MSARPYEVDMDIVAHDEEALGTPSHMHQQRWVLIILVVLSALFLIGVGVTGGIR